MPVEDDNRRPNSQPQTRRELRELESRRPTAVASKRRSSVGPPKKTSGSPRRKAATVVVMTLTGGLIATMALPAYAFGGGGNFGTEQRVAESGEQTLIVPDASAALAVSRDNYTAPTPEELEASRQAAAAAVAATQAAEAAAEATQAAEAAAEAKKSAPTAAPFAVNPPSGPYSGEAIVAYAQQFVGVVPYGTGATPDTSFGCDGLTQYVFAAFGIYLPRMVSNQAAMGIPIAPEDAQAGDLVVWPGTHIGIYDGNGQSIDSPDWGRFVEHRPLWGSYYFVRIV